MAGRCSARDCRSPGGASRGRVHSPPGCCRATTRGSACEVHPASTVDAVKPAINGDLRARSDQFEHRGRRAAPIAQKRGGRRRPCRSLGRALARGRGNVRQRLGCSRHRWRRRRHDVRRRGRPARRARRFDRTLDAASQRSAFPAAAAVTSPTSTPAATTASFPEPPVRALRTRADTPADFIQLVKRHRIAFHEKHKGQLVLRRQRRADYRDAAGPCGAGNVQWRMPCTSECGAARDGDQLDTDAGVFARRASSSPPAGFPSRRSARPTSAIALRASSACASSSRDRRWCR